MIKKLVFVFFLATIFIISGQAHASLIPTTITHSAFRDSFSYFASPPSFGAINQSGDGFAYEFSLSQPHRITDIYGVMQVRDLDPSAVDVGFLNAVIYEGTINSPARGIVPNVSNKIFSQVFTVTEQLGFTQNGVSGLNFQISPGTYWVAFEPAPQGFEGFIQEGFSLYGNPLDPVIPEPSTMLLLGGGMLGTLLRRKKSRLQ